MGKFTISMSIFNSYVKLPEGRSHQYSIESHENPITVSHYKIPLSIAMLTFQQRLHVFHGWSSSVTFISATAGQAAPGDTGGAPVRNREEWVPVIPMTFKFTIWFMTVSGRYVYILTISYNHKPSLRTMGITSL